MLPLDRGRLAAQATAFVAVLVIGGFTHHTPTSAPAPGGTPSASAKPGAAVSPAARGPALKLTVKVTEDGTGGLSLAGRRVTVLQGGTLASAASGPLNPALEFAANVPAGQYQVCLDPPAGWASTARSTRALSGWICSAADLRTAPQLVTFHLAPQVSQVGQ